MHIIESRPACTILMPVYNGERFLEKTIVNLIDLAGQDDELLIINDGSTDRTEEILQNFARLDSRISVRNLLHSGIVSSLNVGIAIAKHPFIARADVDDFFEVGRIETQVRILESDVSIAAVFSDYSFISENGSHLGTMPSAVTWEATALSLSSGVRTAHPSVMFRRDTVLAVGGYKESDFPAEDLGLWVRLVKEYKLVSEPQRFLCYTINLSGISNTRSAEMKKKRDEILLELDYKKLLEDCFKEYSSLRQLYRSYSFHYERLALHNIELLIVIFRMKGEVSAVVRMKSTTAVLIRLLNPKIIAAIFRLFWERSMRKKSIFN